MPEKIFMIGYHPLFYTPQGYEPGSFFDIKENQQVLKTLDNIPSVHFHGVLWAAQDEQSPIYPIIVSDHAKQVAKHLNEWTSENPRDWFKFYHLQYTYKGVSSYGMVLHPDINMSIKRVALANTFSGHRKVNVNNITMIYKPIGVFAKVSDAYKTFAKQNTQKLRVYLADTTDVKSMTDLDKLKDLEPIDLGEFDIAKPTWCNIKKYCQSHIKKLIEEELI